MYTTFYGLREKPFSLLPDPDYLYLSKQHRTALDLLEYSLINQAGFCVITGEIGAGKTTLIRRLLNLVDERVTLGLLRNVHNDYSELLRWVLMAFGVDYANKTKVELHAAFTDFVIDQYAKNKRTVLIVDEAQHMQAEALEELRMLSNINADKDQVVQVILAGQKELRDTLRRAELAQFAQRIVVDYHLGPLTVEDTRGYIHHRIQVAGGRPGLFEDAACADVHKFSEGIPRLINLLCDMSLVYGYAEGSRTITAKQVQDVVRERNHGDLLPTFRWLAAASSNRQDKLEHAPSLPPSAAKPHHPERRKNWAAYANSTVPGDTATEITAAAPSAEAMETPTQAEKKPAPPAPVQQPDLDALLAGEELNPASRPPHTRTKATPPAINSTQDDATAASAAATREPNNTASDNLTTSLFSALDAAMTAKTAESSPLGRTSSTVAQVPNAVKTSTRVRPNHPAANPKSRPPMTRWAVGVGLAALIAALVLTQRTDNNPAPEVAAMDADSTTVQATEKARQQAETAKQAAEAARQAKLREQERQRQAEALAAKQAAEAEAARQAKLREQERQRQAEALAAKQAAEAEAARQAQLRELERQRQAEVPAVAQTEASPAPAEEPTHPSVDTLSDASGQQDDLGFTANPCKGVTARYMSTCR